MVSSLSANFFSLEFISFFVLVWVVYLACGFNLHVQNVVLLAASYWFYCFYFRPFAILLGISIVLGYFGGLCISHVAKKWRPAALVLFAWPMMLMIGTAKYVKFVPIGLSFYTFQGLGYLIDVYREEAPAERNPITYQLFISFFPQILSGPIHRANELIPQIMNKRHISWADINAGLYLILFGYFKKFVIADNLAIVTGQIFLEPKNFGAPDMIITSCAFTVQLYANFSGYTDIVRGLARLMGFNFALNFRLPLFAKNPTEFWNRWHISLSRWVRDYIYTPLALAGSMGFGTGFAYVALLFSMVLIGIFHGLTIPFLLFGVFHGVLLIVHKRVSAGANSANDDGRLKSAVKRLIMFGLIVFGFVIFRSPSIDLFISCLMRLIEPPTQHTASFFVWAVLYSLPLFFIEILQWKNENLFYIPNLSPWKRGFALAGLMVVIFMFRGNRTSEFVYFHF